MKIFPWVVKPKVELHAMFPSLGTVCTKQILAWRAHSKGTQTFQSLMWLFWTYHFLRVWQRVLWVDVYSVLSLSLLHLFSLSDFFSLVLSLFLLHFHLPPQLNVPHLLTMSFPASFFCLFPWEPSLAFPAMACYTLPLYWPIVLKRFGCTRWLLHWRKDHWE